MERNPDRGGYLEFRHDVNSGNDHLRERAQEEWDRDGGALSTNLGCYYELLLLEERLDHYRLGDGRALDAHMQEHVKELKSQHLQQELSKTVRQRILEWDARKRELLFRREAGHEAELAQEIKKRHAEKPKEPEKENWFWAKLAVGFRLEGDLIRLEKYLHADLDLLFDKAHDMDHQHTKALEDRKRELGRLRGSRFNSDRKSDADRER